MASVGIESGDHSCPNEHGIFAKLFSESLGPDLRWPFLSRAGVGLCISAYFCCLPEQCIVIQPCSHLPKALSRKSRFEAALKGEDTQVRAVKLVVQPMLHAHRIHIPILSTLYTQHITILNTQSPISRGYPVPCQCWGFAWVSPFCIIPSPFEEIEEALADLEGEPSYFEVGSSVGTQNFKGSVGMSSIEVAKIVASQPCAGVPSLRISMQRMMEQ